MPGPQLPGEAEAERLVPGAGDLEEHPALLAECDSRSSRARDTHASRKSATASASATPW